MVLEYQPVKLWSRYGLQGDIQGNFSTKTQELEHLDEEIVKGDPIENNTLSLHYHAEATSAQQQTNQAPNHFCVQNYKKNIFKKCTQHWKISASLKQVVTAKLPGEANFKASMGHEWYLSL